MVPYPFLFSVRLPSSMDHGFAQASPRTRTVALVITAPQSSRTNLILIKAKYQISLLLDYPEHIRIFDLTLCFSQSSDVLWKDKPSLFWHEISVADTKPLRCEVCIIPGWVDTASIPCLDGCRSFDSLLNHLNPDLHILVLQHSALINIVWLRFLPLSTNTSRCLTEKMFLSPGIWLGTAVLTWKARWALFCPELSSTFPVLPSLPCGTSGSTRAKPQLGMTAVLVEEVVKGRAQLYLSHRPESQVGSIAERQAREKVCHAFSD